MRARPSSVGTVIGSIFLGVGALLLGAAGSCFMILGTFARAEGSSLGESGPAFGIGALLIGAAIACVVGIVQINRRR
jgi:hypothetical protein